MLKILHFADAHIDIVSQGRQDPASGLPIRVLDFLKALDTIIDTAIAEKVDLVLFAGDAYKDRTPSPTYQREWGRRMMRLSEAGIPILLLVGNHDLPPATGRAHTLQEFETLQVPHVHVVARPCILRPSDLEDLPLQVIALPWVSRSGLMAALQLSDVRPADVYAEIGSRLNELVQTWLDEVDPRLPTILTAHASVQSARYGAERSVMLGSDVVLPGSMVRDTRLDYVALGHIHKAQDLNEGLHPPVVYPGSIERVDFGEAADDKFFVIAELEKGKTSVSWRKLEGRRFIDRFVAVNTGTLLMQKVMAALPPAGELKDAIVRLVVEYPRELEPMLDEVALRRAAEPALEFHLIRKPRIEARLRLPEDQTVSSLSPLDLLDIYWKTLNVHPDEITALQKLAAEILGSSNLAEE
ncbi:MAG: exonuclease SbcCD subunit D [Anaerolineales bacterium]